MLQRVFFFFWKDIYLRFFLLHTFDVKTKNWLDKNIYATDKSLLETTLDTGGVEFLNVCYIA